MTRSDSRGNGRSPGGTTAAARFGSDQRRHGARDDAWPRQPSGASQHDSDHDGSHDGRPAVLGLPREDRTAKCHRAPRNRHRGVGNRIEPVDAIDHREDGLVVRPLRHGRGQQRPRFGGLARVERLGAALGQFLGVPLALGQHEARTLDVGPRARVPAVEEEDACPGVNGPVVVAGEVAVEAGHEQRLDGFVDRRVWLDSCRLVGARGLHLVEPRRLWDKADRQSIDASRRAWLAGSCDRR